MVVVVVVAVAVAIVVVVATMATGLRVRSNTFRGAMQLEGKS